jgi:hypothetical protein
VAPEERARRAVADFYGSKDEPFGHFIASAIREAVLEERERCAKICENWFDYPNGGSDPSLIAAAAIRGQDAP